jgi:hypothetical protein
MSLELDVSERYNIRLYCPTQDLSVGFQSLNNGYYVSECATNLAFPFLGAPLLPYQCTSLSFYPTFPSTGALFNQ